MNTSAGNSALLLFAHGSSDPQWAEPFVKLKAAVELRQPGRRVELAFLERMAPSFDDAVEKFHALGVRHITVAPIFLAIGGHMRKDLPELIEKTRQRTGIEFRVLPALGEVDALIAAIADWVATTNA
ncbi:MAG: CbiX/SirB N-terminal domain-containing protein [Usitatibacteraceae bacterium]